MAHPDLRPELLALLRAADDAPADLVTRALAVLVEDLRMDVAFVSRFRAGRRVVTHAAGDPAVPSPLGLDHPVGETLCHLVAHGGLDTLVPDTAADPLVAAHPHVVGLGIGAYAGVPLVLEGRIVGTVCAAAGSPVPDLTVRDRATLHTVALYIGEVLGRASDGGQGADGEGLAHGAPVDVPADLHGIAATLAAAGDSVEHLTRPLLQLLQQVTGLESTYLTLVDWEGGTQSIAYALNTGGLRIDEDLTIDWADTLCRRSLDEGRRCTTDVPSVWGDSSAARALGIATYVSVPVLDSKEGVVGTLCAASTAVTEVDLSNLATMDLFARLIATQLEREAAREVERARADLLEQRTAELGLLAEHDPLTGLLNRAGIESWLARSLATLTVGHEQVAVAFLDLDRFKAVNDTYGHATGDRLLRAVGRSLTAGARGGDLVGRLGGDEFVVASVLPLGAATLGGWTSRLRRAAVGRVDGLEVGTSIGVACVTTRSTAPADVLAQADAAMYADKASRRVPATR